MEEGGDECGGHCGHEGWIKKSVIILVSKVQLEHDTSRLALVDKYFERSSKGLAIVKIDIDTKDDVKSMLLKVADKKIPDEYIKF